MKAYICYWFTPHDELNMFDLILTFSSKRKATLVDFDILCSLPSNLQNVKFLWSLEKQCLWMLSRIHISRPLLSTVIIIGSTALRGPWSPSEDSASWSIRLLLLQTSWQEFSRVGLSVPRPNPGYPGGPMFSVRVVCLTWLVPVLKRQDLAFWPCMA
jgi:hypothetical protein